ncbi:MAG TPA: phosphatidylglycerol lysyltransferase domain-containing protein [Patescibacteria group bacterium]|nr:phosphatidylglycerol lysyltransferase domain-containing protein [Patescibacteria group bacterium]
MDSNKTAPSAWALRVVTYGVAAHGVLLMASTLEDQLRIHFTRFLVHVSGLVIDVPLLLGLTLLYLSSLLRRRKRTAWVVSVGLYACIVFIGLFRITLGDGLTIEVLLRDIFVPAAMVAGLVYYRGEFTVKSDVRSFAFSLRFIALVLAVTFVYGVTGFMLMDRHDFHTDITLSQAASHTIDQFDLSEPALTPYTRRAKLFVDSLSVVSVGALAYGVVSLFQPIRARLQSEEQQRELAQSLLERYHGSSEDFFKLWPHDKLYFFNLAHTAGIAYAVHRGVALVAGDPFGRVEAFDALLTSFDDFCRANDWAVAIVHTEPKFSELYQNHGFSLQKIGEEAALSLAHFENEVGRNKYFRHIRNKFEKQDFTTELLKPPHNDAVFARLQEISNDWLKQPGRAERRFLLGYFTPAYMQHGPIMVLRDAAGTIQAFINQIPSYDPEEANFDLLRHTNIALGNANDFLMMNFIHHLHQEGFKRLNLGLCPLSGLEARDEERSVVDSALRFVYANGDRLYSFSGLHRFKAKYEPEWSSRYIAYRGGIRGFTRTVTALSKATKV